MIIGIDAGCLGVSNNGLKGGVYYVALHLLLELAKLDKKNTYILYSFAPIEKTILEKFPPAWKNIVLPSIGWLYLSLPVQFLRQKPDVFLALSQAMPWYHPFKTIGFIHGLDFLPEFHGSRNTKLKKNSEYMISNADVLITTSGFLKMSLEKQYKKTNVLAVHLGIDPIFFNQSNPYKTDKPYFLFVGTLKASKNIPTILKAFAWFLLKSRKNYNFLFIGSDFWLDKEINTIINILQLKEHITFIPFVENDKLITYYQGATAFVSPSLYEGFGMTFVEAMASGCPIIASKVGAIPEIVGSVGLLYEPTDFQSMTDGMIDVMKNKHLREKLIRKGKKRAKEFSWEKFAKNVLHTYV